MSVVLSKILGDMFKMEMQKVYDPKEIEKKWHKIWQEKKSFSASDESAKEPYTIVIPPPNVTGFLHMGHALNNTLQDVIIRTKRMQGYEACWIPGTDHAGIATQNVVEKKLAQEGKTRHDLGREKFVEEVWKWKEKHGSYIIEQLKRLGSSCDWDRERFTMDEGLSNAVKESFIELFDKKLIYKGKYIINYCPRCETALADDEVDYQDKQGNFWHIKYPITGEDGKFIIVATTRPETMLGDTAVAVNPKDERYAHLVGKTVDLPLTGKKIPIIADDYVDKEFGSGIVKITPAHDPNDFHVGERHGLEKINIFDKNAKINENAPRKYFGMDRFEARKVVVADLQNQELLEKVEPHEHSVGECYRCNTVIEPYLSNQWFVSMKPLAKKAIEALEEGDIRFVPSRWSKVYLNWMNGIRDWCISRQIWWGHKIPVYYKKDSNECVAAKSFEEACQKLGTNDIYQDSDVLDTWFSSWLWPFSTQGWPNTNAASLKKFYPTNTLVTAQDIIFFWVARMVMAGYEFTGQKPFTDIYIHGIVRDEHGRKMSKSLGNSIDPLNIIDNYGCDALRFTLMLLAAAGQDVLISEDKIQVGRNFCNKIWNAARFVVMKAEGFEYKGEKGKMENLADRWIFSKMTSVIGDVEKSIETYRFNDAAQTLYDFIWNNFCDWYIEFKKIDLYSENMDKESIYKNIFYIMENFLKLLHPFMPFITEEIYEIINNSQAKTELAKAHFPQIDTQIIDTQSEKDAYILMQIITAIRNLRADNNVLHSKKVSIVVIAESESVKKLVDENKVYVLKMALVEDLNIEIGANKPKDAAVNVVGKNEVFMLLEGLVDKAEELNKLKKEKERLDKMIFSISQKLENGDFLEKAPPAVIEREKEKINSFKKQLELVEENIVKFSL